MAMSSKTDDRMTHAGSEGKRSLRELAEAAHGAFNDWKVTGDAWPLTEACIALREQYGVRVDPDHARLTTDPILAALDAEREAGRREGMARTLPTESEVASIMEGYGAISETCDVYCAEIDAWVDRMESIRAELRIGTSADEGDA